MECTFFWHGPFSQWHPSTFEVKGVEFSHAEQFMMAQKALLFGDTITLGQIMKASTPKDQKVLGRAIKPFDAGLWDRECRRLVLEGNLAKFSQNEDLKETLRKTVGTLMVEASPYDKVWGIGLGPDDPERLDPKKWRGTNYLGEVLTVTRRVLFEHSEDQKFRFSWEPSTLPSV